MVGYASPRCEGNYHLLIFSTPTLQSVLLWLVSSFKEKVLSGKNFK